MKRLLLALLALNACHIENKLEDISDMSVAACEDMCLSVEQDPVPSGCTRSCGPNIGSGATIDDDTAVTSLGTVPGGTCDQIVDCPGATDSCHQDYIDCTQNGESGCEEHYDNCICTLHCESDLEQCNEDAEQARQTCISRGFTDCDVIYDDTVNNYCPCVYDICLLGDAPECASPVNPACGKAQLVSQPPPPAQTGVGQWTVHRTFINYQIARSGSLTVETDAWPVVNAAHHWVAVQVGSVASHEALYLMGLRSGDVLVSLNGISFVSGITNPAPLLALRNANTLALVLRRNGATRTFTYHVVP